jgi:hypothetical protein
LCFLHDYGHKIENCYALKKDIKIDHHRLSPIVHQKENEIWTKKKRAQHILQNIVQDQIVFKNYISTYIRESFKVINEKINSLSKKVSIYFSSLYCLSLYLKKKNPTQNFHISNKISISSNEISIKNSSCL